MDNLTQMAGVGLHSAQEGTPENAHNSIKRYLGGGSLNSPADMKPLASILASVNRRNHSWVCVSIVHIARILFDSVTDGGQSSGNTRSRSMEHFVDRLPQEFLDMIIRVGPPEMPMTPLG